MLDGSYRIDTVWMCFVKLQEEACIRQVDQLMCNMYTRYWLLQHYRNRQYSRKIFKVAKFRRKASRPFRRNFCVYYFVEQARNARSSWLLRSTCWELQSVCYDFLYSSRLILLYSGHLEDRQIVGTYLVQTGTIYIIITIVRSYTRKYHKFVAVCIVMSATRVTMPTATNEWCFFRYNLVLWW